MKLEDDRTDEQKQTHQWAVVAKDKFMSGWGGAAGGASRCAWACDSLGQAERVEKWVRGREEMRYVNLVDLSTYRAPRGTAHFHIYVADPAHHPALRGWIEQQARDYVNREGLQTARKSNHYLTAERHCKCGECFCCHVKRIVDGRVNQAAKSEVAA